MGVQDVGMEDSLVIAVSAMLAGLVQLVITDVSCTCIGSDTHDIYIMATVVIVV